VPRSCARSATTARTHPNRANRPRHRRRRNSAYAHTHRSQTRLTAGQTGRSWRYRAERGTGGNLCASRPFRAWRCGDCWLWPGVSGGLARDQRGTRCCLGRERGGMCAGYRRRVRTNAGIRGLSKGVRVLLTTASRPSAKERELRLDKLGVTGSSPVPPTWQRPANAGLSFT
jgi:hypothetical protein